MQIISAYMLAVLGGNQKPTVDDLAKILDSVGISIDNERAEKFIAQVSDKTVDELIEAGEAKIATVLSASGASGSGSGSGSGSDSGSSSGSGSGSDSDSDSSSSSGPGAAAGFSLF